MRSMDMNRPLSSGELRELQRFFRDSPHAVSPHEADGFLTSVATMPNMLMPSMWKPLLLGEHRFESLGEAQRTLDLVMRRFNEIVTGLMEGARTQPTGSLDDEEVCQWCRGYLKGAGQDAEWTGDEVASAMLLPFSVVAGEVDATGVGEGGERAPEDPSGRLGEYRSALRRCVHELHQYFLARRPESVPEPEPHTSTKVGRNEPCPCGSGQKFKKCCAGRAEGVPSSETARSPLTEQARNREGSAYRSAGGGSLKDGERASEPVRVLERGAMDAIVGSLKSTLCELEDRLGLSLTVRRASYSEINAKIELEVATIREDGLVMDRHAEEFLNRCREFALEPEDLGRVFRCGREELRVVGLKPRAKLPVLCEDRAASGDSRRVRMSAEAVRSHLRESDGGASTLRLLD